MWTQDEQQTWKRWDDVARALDAIATPSRPVAIVFLLGESSSEDDSLFATIRLVKRLSNGAANVVAATEHPSGRWMKAVREAGADEALLVTPSLRRSIPPLAGAVELGPSICPALHASHEPEATISVCGQHHDRMVLTRREFDRWCLAHNDKCPHWRRGRAQ